MESRKAAFRKKFQRSGSLGIPFVPENEIANIREYWSIDVDGEKDGPDSNGTDPASRVSLILKMPAKQNGLSRAMSLLEEKQLIVKHIESRESRKKSGELEILVQVELNNGITSKGISESLQQNGYEVAEPQQEPQKDQIYEDDEMVVPNFMKELVADAPWFPKTIHDLDKSSKRVLMYGTDLDADHPGFKDENYRKRRMLFAEIALNYKHGQPIPRVQYTDEENMTWRTIYKELRELHKKHACREYLENFVLLEKYCGYKEDCIPQLDDISRFLKAKTGFRIRPVAGYLSSRDFLAGLAFRVFHCTQYIRHSTDPFYTPEPDCCHELMGHMPLFADPDFAQFSQEIGLASLGAGEEDVRKLATLYFFTIEFGLCKEDGELKVYGAGLLSSIGELTHAVKDKPEIIPFDPDRVVKQECLITTFQDAYFYTDNFEEVQQKIRLFTSHMKRAFVARYNPYTESIEVLNSKRALTLAVNTLSSDVNLLAGALHKLL